MPPLAQPLIDHRDEIVRLCRAHGVERLEPSARRDWKDFKASEPFW